MKQVIKIKTPGSCGELIQGFYGRQEMLISYPIDLYSEVTFNMNATEIIPLGRKVQQAIALFFQREMVDASLFSNYMVSVENNIPVGKGMASSTADISGVLRGLYYLYDISVTDEKIAEMCCAIEPTDSTIFRQITLFDHINGVRIEEFDWLLSFDVLVLEPEYQINTTDFRQAKKEQLMLKNHHSDALDIFQKAVQERSLKKMCQATYISAKENQEILEKPYLETIHKVADRHGCYGVNVAHSGSIVAILFDKTVVDVDLLMKQLENENCLTYYKKQYMTKVIPGGSQILEE